jgi:hypothetical protein
MAPAANLIVRRRDRHGVALDHIRIENREGSVAVVIDDYELFDYVDDFLTERGLEYDHLSESEIAGRRIFTMHFPATVLTEQISTVLTQLPPDEIQRIWRLNNK